MKIKKYTAQAIDLLKKLILTPSISTDEAETANIIETFIRNEGYFPLRQGNNVWVKNHSFSKDKETILLNSHHDTVKPVEAWLLDPFQPIEKNGKLYGLGSNDAGASLVSLLAAFLYLSEEKLPYNLIFAATAEEEISGKNGIASILDYIKPIRIGIVGEPTQMQMAVAEKGLLVVNCTAKGVSGHAARNEGINAIYEAIPDIDWFKTFQFPKVSELLGSIKMTVTKIEAGYQHNVVPDFCKFTVDIRTNECYSNQEVFEIIRQNVHSEIQTNSFRLNSSQIPISHPLVQKGLSMGLTCFGSPTLSDQALMDFPTLKIGVGDSARSHTADEYVFLAEIEKGIKTYIKLLKDLRL